MFRVTMNLSSSLSPAEHWFLPITDPGKDKFRTAMSHANSAR